MHKLACGILIIVAAAACGGASKSAARAPTEGARGSGTETTAARGEGGTETHSNDPCDGGEVFGVGTLSEDKGSMESGAGAAGVGVSPPPAVHPGQVTVTGSLSADDIRRPILRVLPSLRACYEQYLGTHANTMYMTRMQFEIAASGEVTTAKSVADVPDATLDACLAATLIKLSFPAPAGGGTVQVNYPFHFQP